MPQPAIPLPKTAPDLVSQPAARRCPARRAGLLVLVLALGCGFSAAPCFSASISWGTPVTISGDTDVNTAGSGLYAYARGIAAGGTNVNGVAFTNATGHAAWGNVGFNAGFTADNASAYASNSAPFSGLSSAYKTVLQGGAYGGTASGTVTLNGLTLGHAYAVQIWVNDSRGGGEATRTETAASSNTVTLAYDASQAGGGVGQYTVGTFVADGTSQAFTLTSGSSVQLNAIQVRDNGYVGIPVAYTPTRFNLAKYQPVITDSTNGTQPAAYITDGFVDDNSAWVSGGSGAHWAEVVFPFPVTVGSAQLAMGLGDASPMTVFYFQYLTNGTWATVPGSTVVNNTNVERNVVFSGAVTATAFRVYDSLDNPIRIRQLALYPPNGTNGYPFGTDFSIDLARKQPAYGTANTYGDWPLLAADGLVSPASAWETTQAGSNSLLINLQFTNKLGSAHLYSGATGVAPLANFELQYWTGSGWAAIPGGSVTGNTNGALVIPFTSPVTTTEVQLVFTNSGTSAVEELCVFPANSNGGYPLGTGIVSNTPVAAKYATYSDSYYYLSNAAAGSVIVESNGVPVMGGVSASTWATQTTNWPAQYQVLLNYDNGTYRLINRNSGLCLAGAQMTTNAGAQLVEENYSALPDQDWYLQSVDGVNFYLVNQFSGLVADTQGGALVQNVQTNSTSQLWQIDQAQIFPKKGMAGPNGGTPAMFNANWCYTWWYSTTVTFPFGYNYYPMDFDGYYYRGGTVAGNLWGAQPGWRATGYSLKLLGYNEPDNVGQGTIDPTNGAIAWLNDQNMDLPLTGPAAGNLGGTWLPTFFGYITNWGCRVDNLPGHEYVSPSSGSSSCWMSPLQTAYDTWGIPMWMTEFGNVDWSRDQTWSEEDNYTALAEFMWRAEQTPWLGKYSLFLFQADTNDLMASNPWTETKPAPRSNSFDTNGVLTPFGELYGGWDDDANVETNKAYYVYNSSWRKHLSNTSGSSSPNAQCILVRDSSSQWTLVSAGSANLYYLVSALDGRELSYNGTSVSLVASGTTGTAAQWSLAAYQYGWYYLQHPATGKELSLAYNNTNQVAAYSMVANTTTGTAVEWRFIVPYTPVAAVWTGATNASWVSPGNWNSALASPSINQLGNYNVIFNSQSTANLATVLNFANNPVISNNFAMFGITVSNPPGPVSIGATNTLAIGSGIDLSGASQDLTITAPLYIGVAEGGAGPQFWTVAPGRTLSVNAGVAGIAALDIAGGGTVSLGGTNTYTGATLLNGGTLTISGAGQLGGGNYGSAITDNGVFNYNSSASQVLSGNITGSGSLTVNAPGTLTLSGTNSFGGGTTVNGGTLALSGSGSLGSPAITVAGGAKLDVSGAGTTFALAGGTLANSSPGAVLSGNSDCGAGTVSLLVDGTNAAFLQTNGTLTLSVGTVVTVNNTGAILAPGTYPLIAAAAGGSPGAVSGPLPTVVTVTGNEAEGSASLQIDAAGDLNLVIANSTLQAWSGADGAAWTTAGNWLTGVPPGPGSNVWFNTLSTANLATVLDADFSIGTLTVTAPAGPVSIDGGGGLNTLTISNGVNLGTATRNLTITAPVVLGASQTWAVTNAITLSASGGVSGNAGLSVSGGGTVSLGGTNSYTGATTISAGTLAVSGAGDLGGGSYAGAIADSGAFTYASSAAQTLSGVISGGGSLTNSGAGTLTLTATNTYTGGTTVSGGELSIGGAGRLGNGSYAGAIVLAGNAALEYGSTAGQTLSGNITGAGALTLDTAAGGVTLTLTGGGNTYGGITTISNANRLSVGPASLSPNTPVTIAGTASGGGQLYLSGAGTVGNNFTLSGVGYNDSGNDDGALRLTGGDTLTGSITTVSTPGARIGFLATSAGNYGETISGQITGSGGVDFYGFYGSLTASGGLAATNIVTLANTGPPNNYAGNTYIDNDYTVAAGYGGPDNTILQLGASEQIPNGPGMGILVFGGWNPANINRSCTFELNGFNETVNGISTTTAGTLDNYIRNTASGASTLTVGDGDTSSTYGGTISDGGVGKTLALTKVGAGTLTLTGTGSYIGGTIVNGGTLLVNNSSGSGTGTGTVTINNGGTLGGTGTISGLVTNQPGGTLLPGAGGSGQLTLGGNVTLAAGSTNTFVVNGTTEVASNSVALGGAVAYGGVLNIITNGVFTAGEAFTLFSGAGAANAGNFAGIAGSPGAGLAFSFTNGVLSVVTAGPTLTRVSPNPLTGSSYAVTLNLTGSGFSAGPPAVLLTNVNANSGTSCPATVGGDTGLTVSFVPGTAAGVWTATVVVNGSPSAPVPFTVATPAPVSINVPVLKSAGAGNLVLSGSGGGTNYSYAVESTTNLNSPVVWVPELTNLFDGNGNFTCTNPVPPGATQLFLRIQQ